MTKKKSLKKKKKATKKKVTRKKVTKKRARRKSPKKKVKEKAPEKKNPVGRPSKYKSEYCQKMIEYFDIEPVETITDIYYHRTGEVSAEKERETGSVLPNFERFAWDLGISRDTLTEWRKVHKEFSLAYARCKEKMEEIWKINALKGTYNGAFAIFLGKNVFGYKDKTEVEQSVAVTVMPTIKLKGGKELELDIGEKPE